MSRSDLARRFVVGVALVGITLAGAGCTHPTDGGPPALQATLARDVAVADATVTKEKTGLFGSKVVARVTLKPGYSTEAFETRTIELMLHNSAAHDAQFDVTSGNDGYSIVLDGTLTAYSRDLVQHLRDTTHATSVQAFLGHVEAHLPDATAVPATYQQMASDVAVTRIAADGVLQVSGDTQSIGKSGGQKLDSSFLPAVEAMLGDGATRYTAFMDHDHGPLLTADVPVGTDLVKFREKVRAAGYTGRLHTTMGKVFVEDDLYGPTMPLAAALDASDAVTSVRLEIPAQLWYTSRAYIDTTSPDGMQAVGGLIAKLGVPQTGSGDITYEITAGHNRAIGTKNQITARTDMIRDVLQQRSVQRITAQEGEVVLFLDADHPEDMRAIFATVRSHRWWNTQFVHVVLMRGDAVVEQARFESTADGPASTTNTGPGQAQAILDAWNATAK